MKGHCEVRPAILLLLFALLSQAAAANVESRWGAQELYTRQGHMRYLLLLPPHYDPHRKYELWLSLHGNPGCAEQGIYFYFPEAQQRQVFLLAPQGTGDAAESYDRPDGTKGVYRFLDMHRDRTRILTILDEVAGNYPIDRQRIALLGFSAGCEMGWRLLAARPDGFYFFGGIANGFKHGRPPASAEALRRAAKHAAHFYAAGQDDGFAGPMFKMTAKRLRQYGFELKTAYPAGVGHAIPPAIKVPLIAFMDSVRARKRLEQSKGDHASHSHPRSPTRKGGYVLIAGGILTGGPLFIILARRRQERLRRGQRAPR